MTDEGTHVPNSLSVSDPILYTLVGAERVVQTETGGRYSKILLYEHASLSLPDDINTLDY